jgi:hypothetical protein
MIWIETQAFADQGGPEALVQLALAFWALKAQVSIFPIGKKINAHILNNYPLIANIPQAYPVYAGPKDVVIIPEMLRCRPYSRARVFVYILSVYPKFLGKCGKIAHNQRLAEIFDTPHVIRPYVTPYIREACRHSYARRYSHRSHVLMDNDAPDELSDLLRKKIGERVWVTKRRHFVRSRTLAVLQNADYVVDWNFVGSERLPIEAVLCGATLITSTAPNNSARGIDFALPPTAFVKTYDDVAQTIENKHRSNMDGMNNAFGSLNSTTMMRDVCKMSVHSSFSGVVC